MEITESYLSESMLVIVDTVAGQRFSRVILLKSKH